MPVVTRSARKQDTRLRMEDPTPNRQARSVRSTQKRKLISQTHENVGPLRKVSIEIVDTLANSAGFHIFTTLQSYWNIHGCCSHPLGTWELRQNPIVLERENFKMITYPLLASCVFSFYYWQSFHSKILRGWRKTYLIPYPLLAFWCFLVLKRLDF